MKNGWKQIWSRAEGLLGLDRLTDTFRTFALLHFGFLIFNNLQTVFINTLFFRLTGGADTTLQYNLITYVFNPIGTTLAMYYASKKGSTKAMRLGFFTFIFLYAFFLCVMDAAVWFMPVIAFLVSWAGGYYWMGYCIKVPLYTTDDNRDVSLSVIGMGTGIVNLIMPTITGGIISVCAGVMAGGLLGYYIMFALSIVVALVTVYHLKKLPKDQVIDSKVSLKRGFRKTFRNRLMLEAVCAEFLKGIREGTLAFYLNILLFELIQSEALIGANTLLTGLFSILAYWVLGKRLKPSNRIRYMTGGVTTMLVCTLILFVQMDVITILLFSVINAFFNNFLLSPGNGIYYSVVQKTCPTNTESAEFSTVKSFFLDYGRVAGVLLVMLMPKTTYGSVWGILLLTVLQYAAIFVSSLAAKRLETYVHEEAPVQE
ncbi:MAG TPA: hypothetical protein DCR31_03880 [Ruminococcaceae bacterium]|nr:hypothetical protein [Oscillospiraceae bacterium]